MKKKNSFFNEFKTIFLEAFNLVIDNPLIYVISLLIASVELIIFVLNNLLVEFSDLLLIINRFSMLITLMLISWIAISLDFLNQAYTKKKVEYRNFWKLIAKYFFKILFTLFIFIFVSSILLLILRIGFSTIFGMNSAFSSNYLQFKNGDEVSLVYKLLNSILFFLVTIWSFYLYQIIVEIVVGKQKLRNSFGMALKYFLKNITFFISVTILSFVFNFIAYKIIILIGDNLVKKIVSSSVFTLSGLFTGALLIIKYHKVKKVKN